MGYRTTLADTPECASPFERRRLERSFCMRSCSSDADCRGGYSCIDVSEQNPWGATLLENGDKSGKVCALPYSYEGNVPEGRSSEVCEAAPFASPIASDQVTVLTTPSQDAGVVPSARDAAALPPVDASPSPSDAQVAP